MSILVIRKHQRFAVVRKARLHGPEDCQHDGLLIEVSLDGCRISNVDDSAFAIGQPLTVSIDSFGEMDGEVRWLGDGRIGLHLTRPLHVPELDHLLKVCRGETAAAPRLRVAGG